VATAIQINELVAVNAELAANDCAWRRDDLRH
jgi:hypothetical protein